MHINAHEPNGKKSQLSLVLSVVTTPIKVYLHWEKANAKSVFFFYLCRCSMWILNWIPYELILKQCHFRFRININGPLEAHSHRTKAETKTKIPVCRFYRPQRSCGKVMFSQASVILLTGKGCVEDNPPEQTPPQADTPLGRHTALPGHPLPGACYDIPPCPVCAGINPPPPTATAADGTHPTGMHSVFRFRLRFRSVWTSP